MKLYKGLEILIMEIGTCNLTTNEVTAVLQKEKTIILATAADNRVTTRSMSHVNDGMTIYFQTGSGYLKSQQIRINPNVAISVDGYDIEGKATILGHPLDTENILFAKLYKDKHPQYNDIWSTYPEEIVVKVDIEMVRKWRYVDGKPFIAMWKKVGAV
jgi:general stress protein 26